MQPYGYPNYQNNPYQMNPMYQNYNNSFGYGQNSPQYNNNIQPQFGQQTNQSLNEVISGSIVDSIDVVKSKNCALDGSATYYPLSDKSAIYCKQLNPQTGAGMLLTYKLEIPNDNQNNEPIEKQVATLLSGFKEEISEEISELKDMIESSKSSSMPQIPQMQQPVQLKNRGVENK